MDQLSPLKWRTVQVARLLRHFALLSLLAAVCLIGRQRPSWYEAVRYRQGSQLWAPPEWHKDAEGNDVKDTWDHYQMPNCDSGPPPNAKKKVIVGPKIALRKMKEKLKLPKLKIEAVRKMKDVLDLTDPQPQLFATDTLRLRRLRHEVDEGDEPDALPPKLAAVRDLKDGRVHIKYVPVKRTRAQQICAEHIAIASADHAQMIKAHAAFEAHRKAIRGLHYWQGTHRCGIQFYNTDFPAKITWRDDRGHESPAHCQQACTWNHDCEGFSWSKWGCFLKKTPKLPENEEKKQYPLHPQVCGRCLFWTSLQPEGIALPLDQRSVPKAQPAQTQGVSPSKERLYVLHYADPPLFLRGGFYDHAAPELL